MQYFFQLAGSFLISEFDDESVLAMKVDPKDSYLLAGDTAGVIAIFNIKHYCSCPQSTVIFNCIILVPSLQMCVSPPNYGS